MSTGVSLVCADGYSHTTSYQCFCDFRIQITGCGSVSDSTQMWKNLFVLVETVNYLVGIFALALLAWRVVKRNKRLWWQKNMSDTIGLLRPRPVEMFLLLVGMFCILRGLDTSLVRTNSLPSYHSREAMFEIAWQFGLWAVLCYFIGTIYEISLHSTLSTPSLASYMIPSPFALDLYALLLLVTPLITLNVFASLTGIFSDAGNSKVAASYRKIHYGFWSFYLLMLGLGMVWFAVRLERVRRTQERLGSNIYSGVNQASRKLSLGTTTAMSEKEQHEKKVIKKINLTYKSLATLTLFLFVLMSIYAAHRDQIHSSHSNVPFGLLWTLVPSVCFGAIVISLIIKEMYGTDDDSHLNNLLSILAFPPPPFIIHSHDSGIHSDNFRSFSELSDAASQKVVVESPQTTGASREINRDRKSTSSVVSALTTGLYGALSTEFQNLFGIGSSNTSPATASGSKTASSVPETLTPSTPKKFLTGRRLEGWDYTHSSGQTTPKRISVISVISASSSYYTNNNIEIELPSLAHVESIGSLNGVPVQQMFGFGNGTIPEKSRKGKERRISSKFLSTLSRPQSTNSSYYQSKPNSPPTSPSLTITLSSVTPTVPQEKRSDIDSITAATTASSPLTLGTTELLQVPKISATTPSFDNSSLKPTRPISDSAQMGAPTLLLNMIGNLQQSGNNGTPPERLSYFGEDANPEIMNIDRFSGIGEAALYKDEQKRVELAEVIEQLRQSGYFGTGELEQDNEAVLENNAMVTTITTLSQPPQVHLLRYGQPSIVDAKSLSRSNSSKSLLRKNDTSSDDSEGDGKNRKGNRTSTLHDEHDLESSAPSESVVSFSPDEENSTTSEASAMKALQVRLRSLVRESLWTEDDNASNKSNRTSTHHESGNNVNDVNINREQQQQRQFYNIPMVTNGSSLENTTVISSSSSLNDVVFQDTSSTFSTTPSLVDRAISPSHTPTSSFTVSSSAYLSATAAHSPRSSVATTSSIDSRKSAELEGVSISSTRSSAVVAEDHKNSISTDSQKSAELERVSISSTRSSAVVAEDHKNSISTDSQKSAELERVHSPRSSVATTSSTDSRKNTELERVASFISSTRSSAVVVEDYEDHKNSINNNDLMIMQLFFGSNSD